MMPNLVVSDDATTQILATLEADLARHGVRIEVSLDLLDETGAPLYDLSTGEQLEEADLSPEVIELATRWSLLSMPANIPDLMIV